MVRAAMLMFVAVALGAPTAVRAQNVARGQSIYESVCIACHGPASANVYGILTTGANNPDAILAAWRRVPAMNALASTYSAQDRSDIAAYLGSFLPPSGEIRASTAQVDFGAQAVGTRSATRTVTISNFTGSVTIGGVATNDAAEFPLVRDTCSGATLAAGAACELDVAFSPATLGPRGATIMVSNSGVVNPVAFDAIGTGAAASAPVNYQGLWWTATESGWGMNVAHQGDLIYLTWYTYDAAGKASWLAMLATRTASGAYVGTVLEVRGSPYNVVPYSVAAKSVTTVGTGTLSFAGQTSGTFTYTAKGVTATKPITRFSLGGPVPTCTYAPAPDLGAATNYQDLWWNAAEDGWGLNVTHEGTSIYATWYTYDADGSPLWIASLMAPSGPHAWPGPLLRATGPAFGPAFDPAQVHLATVGTATITFPDGNSAAWSFTLNAFSGTKTMTRTLFAAPAATLCK
jgi:mono/diheme cytochrome c family protein